MLRRPRRRRVIKWCGLCASLITFTAWIASGWGFAFYSRSANDYYSTIAVADGELTLEHGFSYPYGLPSDQPSPPRTHLVIERNSQRFLPALHSQYRLDRRGVTLPLWLPFLLLAAPTTILFLRDRRAARLPNSCPHCDYPLTGLAPNSPCPECGKRSSP